MQMTKKLVKKKFSISLDTKNRFETGLKGLTMAAFIQERKNAHRKGLVYNGSVQRNDLVRTLKQ